MKLSNVKKVLEKLNVMLHLDDVTLSLDEVFEAINQVVGVKNDTPLAQCHRCGMCGKDSNTDICFDCRLKSDEEEQIIVVPYQDHSLIKRTYPNWTHIGDIEHGRTSVTLAVGLHADHKVFKQ